MKDEKDMAERRRGGDERRKAQTMAGARDANGQEPTDLGERTKRFALRIIRLYSELPHSTLARVLGTQVLRSGASVGAHYREASRGRSNAEFISKLEGGLQELEEATYWMELIIESGIFGPERMNSLIQEARELNAILTTCAKKAKSRSER